MEALVGMPAANEVSTSASPSSGTQTPADADAGTPAYMRLNSVLDAFRAAARSGDSQGANTNVSGSTPEEKPHSPSLSSVFASVATPESNEEESVAEAETTSEQATVSGESTELTEEPTSEAANPTAEAETDQSGEDTSDDAQTTTTTTTELAEQTLDSTQSDAATSDATLEAATTSEQATVSGESTEVAEEPTSEAANTTTEAETTQSSEATSEASPTTSESPEPASAAAASGESTFTVTAAVSTEQTMSGSKSPSGDSNTAHGNAFLVKGCASSDSGNALRLSADKQAVNTTASLSASSFTDIPENTADSSMLDQAQVLHTVESAEEPAEDISTADSKQTIATEPETESSVASITDSVQSTADTEDVTAESSAEPLEVISAKEYHTQKQNEIHGVWRSDNPDSAYSSHLTEADNHGFNGGKTQGQGLGTMYNAPKSATFMFHEAQDRSEEIREAKRRHDSEQHAFAIDQHVFAGTNSYRQMGAVTVGADSKDTVKPEEQEAQAKEDADKSAYASSSKIQWLSHDS